MPQQATALVRRRLIIAAAACALSFIVVAVLVTAGWAPLARADRDWSSRAYGFTLIHDNFKNVAQVATNLANGWTITVLTGVVALLLAARKMWLLGWWLVLTVSGSALLSNLLKLGLERMRPRSAGELTSAHGFSFPSGHTQAATVTYVAIVLVVGWQVLQPNHVGRIASAGFVTVVVGGVGLSRIYLGAHWPSDVIGGWLSGSAWVLAATVVLLTRHSRSATDRFWWTKKTRRIPSGSPGAACV